MVECFVFLRPLGLRLCHDGSIGLGTVTKNGISSTWTPFVTGLPGGLTAGTAFQATNIDATTGYSPFIGTDLRNDHPVGFDFPVAGYPAGIGTPGISLTVTNSGVTGLSFLPGVSGAVYPVFQYGGGRLDTFECAGSDRRQSTSPYEVSGAQRSLLENLGERIIFLSGRTHNRSRSPRFEASGR